MENFIKAMVIGFFGVVMVPFLVVFGALFSGTLFYFTWNTLAPIYFSTFIPAPWMHFTWWHSMLLMMLWSLIFKSASSVSASK